MKILFTNTYAMDTAWKLWQQGEYPAHHLWGVTQLPDFGIDVDILPHERFPRLRKSRLSKRFGNMDQQLRVLLHRSKYDMVYSGFIPNTRLLAELRLRSLFRKPLVAIVFSHIPKTPQNQRLIDGHDRLICLSAVLKRQIEEDFKVPDGKLELLSWAVDIPFYDSADNQNDEPGEYIFSAGKARRDYDTLIKSALNSDYPLFISCGKKSKMMETPLPERIKIRSEMATTNKDLINDYKRAYAVAIPLEHSNTLNPSMTGYTSLLEAMVMGKAVLMTRNLLIDIDIEKQGFGKWIDPDDVNGWRRAIEYLFSHPDETREMGSRARLLCEKEYSLKLFSTKLAGIMNDVYNENNTSATLAIQKGAPLHFRAGRIPTDTR
jgi:glycosyltransferase involved in cell wall biosynthesis